MKVAVIGIGNCSVADDGAGIFAVRELSRMLNDERVSVMESERGGLELLDLLPGYDRAIIVDAARTGLYPPGNLVTFTLTDHSTPHTTFSLHTIDLGEVLALGSAVGLAIPPFVTLVGVEARDTQTFGAPCTPAVKAALPHATELLAQMLQGLLPGIVISSPARETVPP